jgi:membrane protein implicated in regulation of membrane protease activity
MEFELWHIWVIAGILLLVLEIFTPSFVAGSFGIGAVLTGVVAAITDNINIQIVAFCVLSVLSFVLIRPFLKKVVKDKDTPTNMDSLTGLILPVTETIGPDHLTGYVKTDGDLWRAVEINGKEVKVGEKAKVIRFDGNTLYVEKV